MKTRITELFGIKHPIILAGMSYISTPSMVAAVSNAGGFGLMAAQAYTPDELREAIRQIRKLTDKPFGVNLTLMFPSAMDKAKVIVDERVPVVNYALGRASDLIKEVHGYGGKVIATIALEKHALRSEKDGADAITVTGHEAGAHGGDVTSLVLLPRVRTLVKVPIIAAGGFCDGKGLAAALVLGADAISMGTRFAVTRESPIHDYYKQAIVKASIEDTLYSDRFDGLPARALKTKTSESWMKHRVPLIEAITNGLQFKRELKLSNREFIRTVLGFKKIRKASTVNLARVPVGLSALRRAIEQGDEDGIMMCGQNAGMIEDMPTCAELIERIVAEAEEALAAAEAKARAR